MLTKVPLLRKSIAQQGDCFGASSIVLPKELVKDLEVVVGAASEANTLLLRFGGDPWAQFVKEPSNRQRVGSLRDAVMQFYSQAASAWREYWPFTTLSDEALPHLSKLWEPKSYWNDMPVRTTKRT